MNDIYVRLTLIHLLAVCIFGCSNQNAVSLPAPSNATAVTTTASDTEDALTAPNVLIILADDLGFTDIGAFGGEIATPNLDRLARQGIRLTNFHAAATCAPSRAMLLTGTDNHIAGVGSQRGMVSPSQQGSPAYKNELNPSIPIIPELLRAADYQTFTATKWHVGHDPSARPRARGFDRSVALLEGASRHFDGGEFMEGFGSTWVEDDKPIELPKDFYSTDFFTDQLMRYLVEADKSKPFFALLGVTAPHWPLQAPAASIEKYKDNYLGGWDRLRKARLQGAIREGIVPPDTPAIATEPGVQDWNALSAEEQFRQASHMAVYAAMVDRFDENVGRLVALLDAQNQLSNTMIIFLSDNGAEPTEIERFANREGWIDRTFSNAIDDIGSPKSYISIGPSWARAFTAPLRDSKINLAEGGVRVPAFIRLPERFATTSSHGGIDSSYMTSMDLAPTILAAANLQPAPHFRGRSQWARLQGGEPAYNDSHAVAFELFGRRSVTKGKWKALYQNAPYGTGEWQLYDLSQDLGEQNDLSLNYPELRTELIAEWEKYAQEVGVIIPDTVPR